MSTTPPTILRNLYAKLEVMEKELNDNENPNSTIPSTTNTTNMTSNNETTANSINNMPMSPLTLPVSSVGETVSLTATVVHDTSAKRQSSDGIRAGFNQIIDQLSKLSTNDTPSSNAYMENGNGLSATNGNSNHERLVSVSSTNSAPVVNSNNGSSNSRHTSAHSSGSRVSYRSSVATTTSNHTSNSINLDTDYPSRNSNATLGKINEDESNDDPASSSNPNFKYHPVKPMGIGYSSGRVTPNTPPSLSPIHTNYPHGKYMAIANQQQHNRNLSLNDDESAMTYIDSPQYENNIMMNNSLPTNLSSNNVNPKYFNPSSLHQNSPSPFDRNGNMSPTSTISPSQESMGLNMAFSPSTVSYVSSNMDMIGGIGVSGFVSPPPNEDGSHNSYGSYNNTSLNSPTSPRNIHNLSPTSATNSTNGNREFALPKHQSDFSNKNTSDYYLYQQHRQANNLPRHYSDFQKAQTGHGGNSGNYEYGISPSPDYASSINGTNNNLLLNNMMNPGQGESLSNGDASINNMSFNDSRSNINMTPSLGGSATPSLSTVNLPAAPPPTEIDMTCNDNNLLSDKKKTKYMSDLVNSNNFHKGGILTVTTNILFNKTKTYFFALTTHHLFYFKEDRSDAECLGYYTIDKNSVIKKGNLYAGVRFFELDCFKNGGKSHYPYEFECPTKEDCDDWKLAIKKVIQLHTYADRTLPPLPSAPGTVSDTATADSSYSAKGGDAVSVKSGHSGRFGRGNKESKESKPPGSRIYSYTSTLTKKKTITSGAPPTPNPNSSFNGSGVMSPEMFGSNCVSPLSDTNASINVGNHSAQTPSINSTMSPLVGPGVHSSFYTHANTNTPNHSPSPQPSVHSVNTSTYMNLKHNLSVASTNSSNAGNGGNSVSNYNYISQNVPAMFANSPNHGGVLTNPANMTRRPNGTVRQESPATLSSTSSPSPMPMNNGNITPSAEDYYNYYNNTNPTTNNVNNNNNINTNTNTNSNNNNSQNYAYMNKTNGGNQQNLPINQFINNAKTNGNAAMAVRGSYYPRSPMQRPIKK